MIMFPIQSMGIQKFLFGESLHIALHLQEPKGIQMTHAMDFFDKPSCPGIRKWQINDAASASALALHWNLWAFLWLNCGWISHVSNSCSPVCCRRLFSQPVSAVCSCVGSCHHVICSSPSPYVSEALDTIENATWWLASLWVHVSVCTSVYTYMCVFMKYRVYLCQHPGSQNKLWLSSIPLCNSCFKSRPTSQWDLGA